MNLTLLLAVTAAVCAEPIETLRLPPALMFGAVTLQAAQEGQAPEKIKAAPAPRRAIGDSDALTGLTYVAFDLETTGLYPEVDKIIEIGAVKFVLRPDGKIKEVARFQTLVDPERNLPAFITNLTGIKPEDIAGKPKITKALVDFYAFVEGADVMVAHNASFDTSFLAYHARKVGAPVLKQPTIDTRSLAKKIVPGQPSYSLKKLAANLGVSTGQHHRGFDDAVMCGGILGDLKCRLAAERMTTPGAATWADLKAYQVPETFEAALARVVPKEDTPAPHKPLPQGNLEANLETLRKELWAQGKPNQLSDMARHLGVSYFELRDALAREAAAQQAP